MARVGVDCLGQTSIEGYCREPAQFLPDLGGVYGAVAVKDRTCLFPKRGEGGMRRILTGWHDRKIDFPVGADVFVQTASQEAYELVRWNQQANPLLEKLAGIGQTRPRKPEYLPAKAAKVRSFSLSYGFLI